MNQSLRKGLSAVYLQYTHTGDSIGAVLFDVELSDDTASLRFTLKPVDENQRDDENNLHTARLRSVQIDDERVITRLIHFLESHPAAILSQIEIRSRGNKFTFPVTGRKLRDGSAVFHLGIRLT